MGPNLEMQVNKTQAGLYTVTYGRKEAPLDVQESAFAVNGLAMVSPSQLGFLRAQGGTGTFMPYSRTNADVFCDDRHNQVVIVPDEAISKLVGIDSLVDAHRQGKEYVIPKNQRDLVYAMVDKMLENGRAFATKYGDHSIDTSRFGEDGLTDIMFSDPSLGISAADYGAWLKDQGRGTQSIFFDGKEYATKQVGPYLNRLRVHGPDGVFYAVGFRYLGNYDGAFGVRFEKATEGGAKKS